jgi:hypothetical protein
LPAAAMKRTMVPNILSKKKSPSAKAEGDFKLYLVGRLLRYHHALNFLIAQRVETYGVNTVFQFACVEINIVSLTSLHVTVE